MPNQSNPPPVDTTRILGLAAFEARRFRHRHVGTEHLLLALLDDRQDPTAQLLERFALGRSRVVRAIEDVVGRGANQVPGRIVFSPTARVVREGSVEIATIVGHSSVETPHYVLSLLLERDCVAVEIVQRLVPNPEALAQQTLMLMGITNWSPSQNPRRQSLATMSDTELRSYFRENDPVHLSLDAFFARRHGDGARAVAIEERLAALRRFEERKQKRMRLFVLERGQTQRNIENEQKRRVEPQEENEADDNRSAQD